MTSWIEQAPAILATVALLILPGLPTALLVRTTGILRLGISIAVSVAVIVAATVIAPIIGLRWSLLPVIAVAILVSAVAVVVRVFGRKQAPAAKPRAVPWAWLTTAIAFVGWLVVIGYAIGNPANPSQLYDGIFHLNAVEFISQTGDASPLHMTMAYPELSASFYPTGWHALVALVMPIAGSAVVATNVVSIVVIAVIWPVAVGSLTAVLFVAHPVAAVWAPLLTFGFGVFPMGFLNWGVLYPNLLGNLLLPLFVALVLLACRRGTPTWDRILVILVAVAAAGATALAYPSSLLAGVVLLVPFALVRAWKGWRDGSPATRTILLSAVLVGIVVLGAVWLLTNVSTHSWKPNMTLAQAAGEVAFLSPVGRATGLLLGPLALIGIWRVAKARRWWILWSYGLALFFFIVSASLNLLALRTLLVGVWYDDTTRVAAIVAILALPLAGLGAAAVWSWMGVLARRKKHGMVATIGILVLFAGASHFIALRDDLRFARGVAFAHTNASAGLTVDEAGLFEKADKIVADESVTVGDPRTGAGLFYAYTGHAVVFPHITGSYGRDASIIASGLSTGGPEVCAAMRRLGVDYAFDFGDRVITDSYEATYKGLHHLETSPLLTRVAQSGDASLYRVTGCGR